MAPHTDAQPSCVLAPTSCMHLVVPDQPVGHADVTAMSIEATSARLICVTARGKGTGAGMPAVDGSPFGAFGLLWSGNTIR